MPQIIAKMASAAIGGFAMIRTILIGSCVWVQGLFVRQLEDGYIVVRVGERNFVGKAVSNAA